MVYVDTWDEFAEKAEVLFRADPSKFRYVSKYRHCDGKLVLKATDDRVCIKFRTDQAQDAKKMERLNNLLFTLMARGPDGPGGMTPQNPLFALMARGHEAFLLVAFLVDCFRGATPAVTSFR
ncbi:unnamed protein product [Closterium sp. NIES-65]|nr:unnamed protein product [Closterium sp. NIES-65]